MASKSVSSSWKLTLQLAKLGNCLDLALLLLTSLLVPFVGTHKTSMLCFCLWCSTTEGQCKAKPSPGLHFMLAWFQLRPAPHLFFVFFPMIPGGYLMDITWKFLKEDGCFEKWNACRSWHYVFWNAHPSQMKHSLQLFYHLRKDSTYNATRHTIDD